MTKKHFIVAADMVNNIRKGYWNDDSPSWANPPLRGAAIPSYWRAVQTAEAFMILFSESNPRFDEQRFLVACGLAEKPVKARVKHGQA